MFHETLDQNIITFAIHNYYSNFNLIVPLKLVAKFDSWFIYYRTNYSFLKDSQGS